MRFRDGSRGAADLARLVPFDGVFAPICELAFLARVGVHPETISVTGPNRAVLESDVRHEAATGVAGSLPGAKRTV